MKIPAAFVTDFGPVPAFESDAYTEALSRLGRGLPRPSAIVVMSGHWESTREILITSAKTPGIIHDYFGFPDEFYRFTYPCPGNPKLATEIAQLLSFYDMPAKTDTTRPLDHGAWVPVSRMYPKADISVLQVAVPRAGARFAFDIGRLLAPLRDKGVLLLGAGALSHNLKLAMVHKKDDTPDAWAMELDAWIMDRVVRRDHEGLLQYRRTAPSIRLAAATAEHFDPFFFTLGAAMGEPLKQLYGGVAYGNGLMKILATPDAGAPERPDGRMIGD